VWAALFRRKTRTILTLVSIVTAFLLFGLLDAVRISFAQAGQSANGAQRLQTSAKLSFIETLPISLQQQIAQIPGVKAVTYANWFGGAYQDPHNQVFSFAVPDNYLDLYPEIQVSPQARDAFAHTRTGALVGEKLAQRFHWKVGDQIPLQSTIFPNKQGDKNWSFQIVGVMSAKDKKTGGFFDQMFLLHWKYFDETTPYNQGQAGWYVTRVADVNQADRIAHAIDALSANSDHETRTMTEQAATANWMKQLADIGLIVGSIMGAVFFTLLLLAGNTMMQAVRERTSELAVLKTIGFTDTSVLGLVLAESVLLLVLGGLAGMALAAVVIPGVAAGSGGMLNLPPEGARTWSLGIGLMLLFGLMVGALPALNAMRLNIVDALAGR
jgi:putative ABC transport system permease protein